MGRRHARTTGFTLVELLGVIAIIAMLASILFPVFARARESARTLTCTTNLVNIGMALRMYATDHAGGLPPRENDPGPLVPRHLTEPSALRCPSSTAAIRLGTENPAPPLEECNTGRGNAADVTTYLYRAGRRLDQSPARWVCSDLSLVHNESANVLFSDGGVKRVNQAAWFALGLREVKDPDVVSRMFSGPPRGVPDRPGGAAPAPTPAPSGG
jgi:prepilin-type N-terminal cleavage/methylation domain-containing protein/prepilin-type processing-associated H-X9-DG protein